MLGYIDKRKFQAIFFPPNSRKTVSRTLFGKTRFRQLLHGIQDGGLMLMILAAAQESGEKDAPFLDEKVNTALGRFSLASKI